MAQRHGGELGKGIQRDRRSHRGGRPHGNRPCGPDSRAWGPRTNHRAQATRLPSRVTGSRSSTQDPRGSRAPWDRAHSRRARSAGGESPGPFRSKGGLGSFTGSAIEGSAYPFLLAIPQVKVEATLHEHLRAKGIDVEWGSELTGFEQHADGVECFIQRQPGHCMTVRARYLVGCDGADSRVRDIAGIAFPGSAYRSVIMIGDVRLGFVSIAAGAGMIAPSTWPAPTAARILLATVRSRAVLRSGSVIAVDFMSSAKPSKL